jgi:hypothetical protein
MATFKITLTVELNSEVAPNWIIPSIEEQLEEGETIPEYTIESIEFN